MRSSPLAGLAAAAACTLAAASPAAANVFSVLNNNDSGAGSLRAAITAANGSSGSDTISFAGLPAGQGLIKPLTALPAVGRPGLLFDCTTFPGGQLVIDGSSASGSANAGISFFGYVGGSNGGILKGCEIVGFSGPGVIGEASGVTIEGNLIGTDGSVAKPNAEGIELMGVGDTVGGLTAAARNVISGNTGAGIAADTSFTGGNLIEGNFIGTNAAGTAAVPNGGGGVLISNHADQNKIGSGVSGAGNVISGNSLFGVEITGPGSNFNLVQGNFIGIDPSGNPLGNQIGVEIGAGASNNTIGGGGAENTIAGNKGDGIDIAGDGTQAGGTIGTHAAPNGGDGVRVTGGTGVLLPAQGASPGTATVTNNAGNGLEVSGGSARVLGGTFSNNGASGILAVNPGVLSVTGVLIQNNGAFGVSLPGGAFLFNPQISGNPSGALQIKPAPAFTVTPSLSSDGATVKVVVSGATPGAPVQVELGRDQGCNGTTFQQFANNYASVTSDAGGNATLILTLNPAITDGLRVLVTDPTLGTKDAGCVKAATTNPPPPAAGHCDWQVSFSTPPPATQVLPRPAKFTITVRNAGSAACPATDLQVDSNKDTEAGRVAQVQFAGNPDAAPAKVAVPRLDPGAEELIPGSTAPSGEGLHNTFGIPDAPPTGRITLTASMPADDDGGADEQATASTEFITEAYTTSPCPRQSADLRARSAAAPAAGCEVGRGALGGFSGVALPGVKRVEVALGRVPRGAHLARAVTSCVWLRNARAQFERAAARKGRCAPVWLKATGTRHWRFRLRRHLPSGQYALFVRGLGLRGQRAVEGLVFKVK